MQAGGGGWEGKGEKGRECRGEGGEEGKGDPIYNLFRTIFLFLKPGRIVGMSTATEIIDIGCVLLTVLS